VRNLTELRCKSQSLMLPACHGIRIAGVRLALANITVSKPLRHAVKGVARHIESVRVIATHVERVNVLIARHSGPSPHRRVESGSGRLP
jgi:hypothetical protein